MNEISIKYLLCRQILAKKTTTTKRIERNQLNSTIKAFLPSSRRNLLPARCKIKTEHMPSHRRIFYNVQNTTKKNNTKYHFIFWCYCCCFRCGGCWCCCCLLCIHSSIGICSKGSNILVNQSERCIRRLCVYAVLFICGSSVSLLRSLRSYGFIVVKCANKRHMHIIYQTILDVWKLV